MFAKIAYRDSLPYAHSRGISHYSVVYVKYSIYVKLYMYDDRVHLENNPLTSLGEFPVSIAFKINVRITLKCCTHQYAMM